MPRASWFYLESLHLACGQLHLRIPQLFHHVAEVLRGQFAGHMERKVFPAVFVEDRQDPQFPAVVRPDSNKVLDPNVVESLGPRGDNATGTVPVPAAPHPLVDPQPAVPQDALHQFSARFPPVKAQGPGQFAIALFRVLTRHGFQLLVQSLARAEGSKGRYRPLER